MITALLVASLALGAPVTPGTPGPPDADVTPISITTIGDNSVQVWRATISNGRVLSGHGPAMIYVPRGGSVSVFGSFVRCSGPRGSDTAWADAADAVCTG